MKIGNILLQTPFLRNYFLPDFKFSFCWENIRMFFLLFSLVLTTTNLTHASPKYVVFRLFLHWKTLYPRKFGLCACLFIWTLDSIIVSYDSSFPLFHCMSHFAGQKFSKNWPPGKVRNYYYFGQHGQVS